MDCKVLPPLSLTQSQTSQTSLMDLDQYQMIETDKCNAHIQPISDSKQSDYVPSEFHSDVDHSDVEFSDDDDDDMPLGQLLLSIQRTEEDIVYATNGYRRLEKISDTTQGHLYKAEVTKTSLPGIRKGTFVAIKRTDKDLMRKGITIQDGVNCLIDKNAIKEALIMQQLTLLSHNNNIIGSHIISFIDLFESRNHFYLVMEYVENGITLKEFIKEAHGLIKQKKLSWKDYSKIVKSIMWQLLSVIRWLHEEVLCCHLDVCLDNIILKNGQFIKKSHNSYKISNQIQLKLVDFGFAELCSFAKGDENETKKAFEFVKHRLNIETEFLASPEIYKAEAYDCRSSDIWSVGMLFHQCVAGQALYEPQDMFDEPRRGYQAVMNNELKQYLKMNNVRYFNNSISLLTHLLIMDTNKRFNATQAMKHKYFKKFYKTSQKN